MRNPLPVATKAVIRVSGVPEGFYVYFPHRMVALPARGQRNLEILIVPLREIPELLIKIAGIRVSGYVPHKYVKGRDSSLYREISGLQAVVEPKRGSRVRLVDPRSGGKGPLARRFL